MAIRIFPPEDFLEAALTLPLSKSMSARALIMAALTPGASLPADVARCDDTDTLLHALSGPGATDINIGAAGTAMRFLTAYYAATPAATPVRLDGSGRMRRRPIGVLVDALRSLGARIDYAGEEGFPPLLIHGSRLEGGDVEMDATVSSQYISALLMIAPVMERGLRITLRGEAVSTPYIRMTLAMMSRLGADASFTGPDTIEVAPGGYDPSATPAPIEADWSAAAPWYEIESLSAGSVTITNLPVRESVQGDRILADIFSRLGVITVAEGDDNGGLPELTPHPDPDARANIDFSPCPDLAQCTAVTCAMTGTPFRFTGLSTLSIKETDRMEALRRELLKVGAVLTIPAPGVLEWDGKRVPVTDTPVFDTYDDHRMAMCLAPVALYMPGIVINHPEVVSKSYPGFWDDLSAAGFTIEPVGEEAPAS